MTPKTTLHRESAVGGRPGRREVVLLLVLLTAGIVLRGLYLGEVKRAPDLDNPPVDEGFTLYWARGLATDDWSLPPEARGRDPEIGSRSYLRPPGYAFTLAALYRLADGDAVTIRALQMAAGLLILVLAWWLGRQLFDGWVGLTWAFLLLLSWPLLYFESCLNGTWLVAGLFLLLLLALRRLVLTPTSVAAAAVGGLVGLVALVRPNVLLAVPALLLWGLWVLRRRDEMRRALPLAAVAAVVGLAVLGPSLYRNWSIEGRLVPVSANGGLTLYHSNNDSATGLSGSSLDALGVFSSPWDESDIVARVEERVGRELNFAEASDILGEEARTWIAENPRHALRLVARRAALFWGPHEIPHNRVVGVDRERSQFLGLLPVGFHVAAAGFLVGCAFLLLRRKSDRAVPLPEATTETVVAGAILVVMWFLSFLPFLITSLYRTPVIPLLLLPAAALLVEIVSPTGFGRRASVLWGAALVCTVALSSIPIVSVPSGEDRWLYERGLAHARVGNHREAVDHFRLALAENPFLPQAHNGLGKYLLDGGDTVGAENHFRQAVLLNPSDPVARFNLGLTLALAGRWEEAEEEFTASVVWGPENTEAWLNLAISRENLGLLAEAVPAYERVLAIDPKNVTAANNFAWLLATAADPALRDGRRAVEFAQRVAAISADASSLDTLAAAFAEAGRFEEAVATGRRAVTTLGGAQTAFALEIEERVTGYLEHHPFRQPPPVVSSSGEGP